MGGSVVFPKECFCGTLTEEEVKKESSPSQESKKGWTRITKFTRFYNCTMQVINYLLKCELLAIEIIALKFVDSCKLQSSNSLNDDILVVSVSANCFVALQNICQLSLNITKSASCLVTKFFCLPFFDKFPE